jgi:hypothetical protein
MLKANVNGNVLRDVIGDATLQRLGKDGKTKVGGLTLVLLTAEEGKVTFTGPVLALHVTPDALDKLGAAPKDVIFVPWKAEELAAVLKAGGNWTKIYP